MRIVLVHPNYHSGGAEIAGNWPPAWVAYLAGPLRKAGFDDIHFVDAMTNDLSEEAVRDRLAELRPDIVGVTAITPSIYTAERLLEIAREACPQALRVLGGVHATFMYKQVLSEAPWVDVIVRGEGEEIFLELVRSVAEGTTLLFFESPQPWPGPGGKMVDEKPKANIYIHTRYANITYKA